MLLRQLSLAACIGLGLGLFAAEANAAPRVAPLGPAAVTTDNIINVAEGCGRGRFRNRHGRCRNMRGHRHTVRKCVTRINRFGDRRRVCTIRRR